MGEYVELTATVAPPDAERAAEILRGLADGGASIERPFAQASLEADATRAAGDATVRVYFRGTDASANASLGRAALDAAGIPARCTASVVEEADWADAWKRYFDVERYGDRIVVVPSWKTYEPRTGDVVIALDPGMAFGTGQHETTRMCLEAVDRLVSPGMRVLDVGCGSGILSLAAARLGAREVVALDIDPDAVRITESNARANGVEAIVRPRPGTLDDEALEGAFDVVASNIVASVIVDLAPRLVAALAPGGMLVVSGIIGERETAVCHALRSAGACVVRVRAMSEWRCIEAARR